MPEAAFRDLRRLADWFSTSPQRPSPPIDRLVARLGATALPLLTRALCSGDPCRREAARDALGTLAARDPAMRARVVSALHAITHGALPDEAKVVAHGLLSELGEPSDVRFADPAAIRVRSAIALASHLETDADLAGAADLMIQQLEPDDLVQMLEAMAGAAPAAAHRLAGELAQRLDIPGPVRNRVTLAVAAAAPAPVGPIPAASVIAAPAPAAPIAAASVLAAPASHRRVEASQVAVLVDAAARLVVIACHKRGARRFRRWAVLIGAASRIEDCLHEDDAGDDAAPLIATLCADGYRVASRDADRARELVATAARRTAESSQRLPSSYYLGRDLLALGDIHLGERGHRAVASAALGRAIELVAAGDHAAALPLLERCDPAHPEAAAALAAIRLARGEPLAAIAPLERALAAEPDWPLHHWNLAAALHQLGDARGCYHALRRFVATSAAPSGLYADPDQPARVGRAERIMAELERTARLTGRSLGRRPRLSARAARPSRSPRDRGATS